MSFAFIKSFLKIFHDYVHRFAVLIAKPRFPFIVNLFVPILNIQKWRQKYHYVMYSYNHYISSYLEFILVPLMGDVCCWLLLSAGKRIPECWWPLNIATPHPLSLTNLSDNLHRIITLTHRWWTPINPHKISLLGPGWCKNKKISQEHEQQNLILLNLLGSVGNYSLEKSWFPLGGPELKRKEGILKLKAH